MGATSSIEWTDASWTPIRARNLATGKLGWHCEHASEACRYCYAENFNRRLGTRLDFKPGHREDLEIFLDEQMLLAPLKWKKPRMIFVCSMTDLFADFVTDEMIDRMFAVMALAPQHTFQVLTKRPGRMLSYHDDCNVYDRVLKAARPLRDQWPHLGSIPISNPQHGGFWPHVWKGVSAEDQKNANERIPDLLQTPAAIRFVSFEPLLGPINLRGWETYDHGCAGEPGEEIPRLDWVIVGGERGPRPMHPDWVRSIRDQCQAAGVPFFFKQWGDWAPADTDPLSPNVPMNWRERPGLYACLDRHGRRRSGYGGNGEEFMIRVGKARAGRLLDGCEHNGMPA